MQIKQWKKDGGGIMVEVSTTEAIRIIKSLSAQILDKNPNGSRVEFSTDIGYFSIAVFPMELK